MEENSGAFLVGCSPTGIAVSSHGAVKSEEKLFSQNSGFSFTTERRANMGVQGTGCPEREEMRTCGAGIGVGSKMRRECDLVTRRCRVGSKI